MNITAMIPMVLFSQAIDSDEIIHLPPARTKGKMSLKIAPAVMSLSKRDMPARTYC